MGCTSSSLTDLEEEVLGKPLSHYPESVPCEYPSGNLPNARNLLQSIDPNDGSFQVNSAPGTLWTAVFDMNLGEQYLYVIPYLTGKISKLIIAFEMCGENLSTVPSNVPVLSLEIGKHTDLTPINNATGGSAAKSGKEGMSGREGGGGGIGSFLSNTFQSLKTQITAGNSITLGRPNLDSSVGFYPSYFVFDDRHPVLQIADIGDSLRFKLSAPSNDFSVQQIVKIRKFQVSLWSKNEKEVGVGLPYEENIDNRSYTIRSFRVWKFYPSSLPRPIGWIRSPAFLTKIQSLHINLEFMYEEQVRKQFMNEFSIMFFENDGRTPSSPSSSKNYASENGPSFQLLLQLIRQNRVIAEAPIVRIDKAISGSGIVKKKFHINPEEGGINTEIDSLHLQQFYRIFELFRVHDSFQITKIQTGQYYLIKVTHFGIKWVMKEKDQKICEDCSYSPTIKPSVHYEIKEKCHMNGAFIFLGRNQSRGPASSLKRVTAPNQSVQPPTPSQQQQQQQQQQQYSNQTGFGISVDFNSTEYQSSVYPYQDDSTGVDFGITIGFGESSNNRSMLYA